MAIQLLRNKFLNLLLLFTLLAFDSFSVNYYFSSSTGNDSYTATQAQNPSTPWKTIDKLNTSMNLINPGDSILFKRGDVFTGKIVLTRSGSSAANIAFGAYGTGKLPVIKGTLPVTGWTQYSGNIWVASCPQLDTIVTNFFINGIPQQIGRYPNADAPNGGYLNIDAHTGRTAISCSALPSAPDFTGAEAVVRTRRWIIDRLIISMHQGNTISLKNSSTYEFYDNYGFFIQNHLNTLDKNGEWYYDIINKKLYLFHSSNPNSFSTEATAFTTIFEATFKQYFSIENIEFKGASLTNILISNSNNILFKNNIVTDAGDEAIKLITCVNSNITNNSIFRTNNNALFIQNCKNSIVSNNHIHRTGIWVGMHINTATRYTALLVKGTNIKCESNTIDSIGYIGIHFAGDTILIKNNIISHFCMTLDDGGAIYTASSEKIMYTNRKIEKNIILNGIGAPEGTESTLKNAQGIYLDDRSHNIQIINNTVAHCPGYGLYIHNSNNFSIVGNTSFNNSSQIAFVHDNIAPTYPIRNGVIQNNIFFSKINTQLVALFKSIKDDIDQFGTFDYNYYCRPSKDFSIINTIYSNESTTITSLIDLIQWQKTYKYDLNSNISPFKIPIFKITELIGANKCNNGYFKTNISGWTSWANYNNGNISWDNSGTLDTGCMKISFNPLLDNANAYLLVYSNIGEVKKNENYILRFSMVTTTPDKKIKVILRNGNSPYNNIADEQFVIISQNRNNYELLFTPTSSETIARIDFEIQEGAEPCWLDNVQFYKAEVIKIISEDSIKFFYNPSGKTLSINDNNYYIDVRGNKYYNFSIQPFSSLILFKVNEEFYRKKTISNQNYFLIVYPNPAKDFITLLTNNYEKKMLNIFNLNGEIILNKTFFSDYMVVDVQKFMKGTYIIKLKSQTVDLCSKFIVR